MLSSENLFIHSWIPGSFYQSIYLSITIVYHLFVYLFLKKINTLLLLWKWKSLSCVWLCDPHGLYTPCSSPGQNNRVGSYSFLQRIFPTQGSNPGLPHCRQIILLAEPAGKPKNTGVDSFSLSSGDLANPGIELGSSALQQILYKLSYQWSPPLLLNPFFYIFFI